MSKNKKPMIHRIPITKARINLGQVVKRAHINADLALWWICPLESDGQGCAASVVDTQFEEGDGNGDAPHHED